jgi:hypothetical protein
MEVFHRETRGQRAQGRSEIQRRRTTMKKIQNLTMAKLFAAALLAALLSVGVAGAQSPIFKAKFTLPYQVQWGKAILPAGEYWFSLDPATPSRLTLHGHGQAAGFLMPRSITEGNAGKKSLLVIERGGNQSTVRALRLAELNVVFEYAAPKTETREAKGNKSVQEIAVSAARD